MLSPQITSLQMKPVFSDMESLLSKERCDKLHGFVEHIVYIFTLGIIDAAKNRLQSLAKVMPFLSSIEETSGDSTKMIFDFSDGIATVQVTPSGQGKIVVVPKSTENSTFDIITREFLCSPDSDQTIKRFLSYSGDYNQKFDELAYLFDTHEIKRTRNIFYGIFFHDGANRQYPIESFQKWSECAQEEYRKEFSIQLNVGKEEVEFWVKGEIIHTERMPLNSREILKDGITEYEEFVLINVLAELGANASDEECSNLVSGIVTPQQIQQGANSKVRLVGGSIEKQRAGISSVERDYPTQAESWNSFYARVDFDPGDKAEAVKSSEGRWSLYTPFIPGRYPKAWEVINGVDMLAKAGFMMSDARPSNFLVLPEGECVPVDFGLVYDQSEEVIMVSMGFTPGRNETNGPIYRPMNTNNERIRNILRAVSVR